MTVTKNSFADLVRIEQLRRIESVHTEPLSYKSVASMDNNPVTEFKYTDFVQRLTRRADLLMRDNGLEAVIAKPQQQFKYAGWTSLIVAAILGGMAAGNAVSESHTLNIYWLLAVLLGFNLVSLILWVIGISFRLQSLSSGVAAQLASWASFRRKDTEETTESLASRAWWESCLTGAVGKWRISMLTHQFWLAYLAAGLILLILLMMAKQYNFVWGTTLLSESSLPRLTESLSRPLQVIGLEMPDSHQISISRMGESMQDPETRAAWARFLIGVLLVYGLLPRLIVLTFSVVMLRWAERGFRLDLYLPYYVELRQRLMTRGTASKVIDADPLAGMEPPKIVHPRQTYLLPAGAHALGIELDDQTCWPEAFSCQYNIVDMQSLAEAVECVKKLKGALVIGVAAYRLPDRGIQRMIADLLAVTHCTPWLLLLNKNPAVPVTESREMAWFRLAENCQIPAEHVITS
ncbi:MAG: DUF2868 domain-containing protein [Nitrosomonas sp.]|nr:DUF2868 domain-containing protein [Nitrosomonas sp.]